MKYSRRQFSKLALAAVPAAQLLPTLSSLQAAEAKPTSKVNGVQIGLNVPWSFFKAINMDVDEILQRVVSVGVSGVELRATSILPFLGPPDGASPEAMQKWRTTVAMEKAKELRKKYEDAGVLIEIVKVDGIAVKPDENEIDFWFNLTKAVGGRAISCELETPERTKRLGQFADKHEIFVGYHNHSQPVTQWEAAFSQAKFNGANVDLGHFIEGNHAPATEFIKKYHERVTHVHVKERKLTGMGEFPLGQGDSAIKEILQLIRDNHWNIQATIEFDNPGPDPMATIVRCVEYCREVLRA